MGSGLEIGTDSSPVIAVEYMRMVIRSLLPSLCCFVVAQSMMSGNEIRALLTTLLIRFLSVTTFRRTKPGVRHLVNYLDR